MNLTRLVMAICICIVGERSLAQSSPQLPPQSQPQTQPELQTLSAQEFLHRMGNATTLAMTGRTLSGDQVKELEKKVHDDPDDIDSRTQLLGHYFMGARSARSDRETHAGHVLWLIEHRPEAGILATPFGEIMSSFVPKQYSKAHDLWLKQCESHFQNLVIINNAVCFFKSADRKQAIELLTKAQTLDPENTHWHEALGKLLLTVAKLPAGDQQTAIDALSALEKSLVGIDPMSRFYKLSDVAKAALLAGNPDKARQYANELLQMALEVGRDWNYGNAVHHGNLVLGHVALLDGNMEAAEAYLLKAGQTPGSPQLNSFGPNMQLAKELLELKRTKAVLEYFDLCAKFWNRPELAKWKADVEIGRIPKFGGNLMY